MPNYPSITIERYRPELQPQWDAFVRTSRNGVFLFERGYMDYHADRFSDHSLMAVDGDECLALLPANAREDALVSHGGLTFGGLIVNRRMRAARMIAVFDALMTYLRERGFRTLVYKPSPHIYHAVPAEEDLYALFRANARLIRRDISAAISRVAREPLNKGRKWSVSRFARNGLTVGYCKDFHAYMDMVAMQLKERHGAMPTHTGAEIALLAERFPENIKLHVAWQDEKMLAGVLMYVGSQVAHAQYIASSAEGRELGAVEGVINHLIEHVYADWPYFDFGISTEREGRYLNAGLSAFKEGFGARSVVYDVYEVAVTPAS